MTARQTKIAAYLKVHIQVAQAAARTVHEINNEQYKYLLCTCRKGDLLEKCTDEIYENLHLAEVYTKELLGEATEADTSSEEASWFDGGRDAEMQAVAFQELIDQRDERELKRTPTSRRVRFRKGFR